MNPPDGFEEIPPYGPFGELTGPIFGCVDQGVPSVRLLIEPRHTNKSTTMLHGGMLCTFADNALIWGIRRLRPECNHFVTTQLSVDLIGRACIGDWLEARVEVIKHGRSLIFAQCLIRVGSQVIARTSGQFSVLPTSDH